MTPAEAATNTDELIEKVLDAVRMLVATKARKGAKRPRVTFSSNLMRMSIEELPGHPPDRLLR